MIAHLQVLAFLAEEINRTILDHNSKDLMIIDMLIYDLHLNDVILVTLSVKRTSHVYHDAHH